MRLKARRRVELSSADPQPPQTFRIGLIPTVLCCRNYGVEDASEGKAAAKAELRRRMELSSADVPLVAVVTRLTHQKGIHLIKHAAWRTLERGAQFVLLGSAPDPRVQARPCCIPRAMLEPFACLSGPFSLSPERHLLCRHAKMPCPFPSEVS